MKGHDTHRSNTYLMCDSYARWEQMRGCIVLLGGALEAQDKTR